MGRSMSEPDTLQLFREGPEAAQDSDAVMLVGDVTAMRLCVAWRRACPVWQLPEGDPPEHPRALWSWAWANVRPPLVELSTLARVPVSTVGDLFGMLKLARLILPNGELASVAVEIIEAHVRDTKAPAAPRAKSKRSTKA